MEETTQILICQNEGSVGRVVLSETREELPTVMDAHRRWATVKNERMGIVLGVTHTDDGSHRVRDELKEGQRRGE